MTKKKGGLTQTEFDNIRDRHRAGSGAMRGKCVRCLEQIPCDAMVLIRLHDDTLAELREINQRLAGIDSTSKALLRLERRRQVAALPAAGEAREGE